MLLLVLVPVLLLNLDKILKANMIDFINLFTI